MRPAITEPELVSPSISLRVVYVCCICRLRFSFRDRTANDARQSDTVHRAFCNLNSKSPRELKRSRKASLGREFPSPGFLSPPVRDKSWPIPRGREREGNGNIGRAAGEEAVELIEGRDRGKEERDARAPRDYCRQLQAVRPSTGGAGTAPDTRFSTVSVTIRSRRELV